MKIPGYKNKGNQEGQSSDSALLMGLSLFIILLAFFIVLNGMSQYAPGKVGEAFDSIDLTFSEIVVSSDFHKQSLQIGSEGMGEGDAIESLQGGLQSVLPNLNMQVDPQPDGGKIMSVRIKKDTFDRNAATMIPLFVRLLNEKDTQFNHTLIITSYVRDPLSANSRPSFTNLDKHLKTIIQKGLPKYKATLRIERGNPAYLMIQFNASKKGEVGA